MPCIIRNAIPCNNSTDGAPLILTLDDIIDRIGEDEEITVDVTPDGHGDCVRTVSEFQPKHGPIECNRSNGRGNSSSGNLQNIRVFVKPHEQKMSLREFRMLLRRQSDWGKQFRRRERNGNNSGEKSTVVNDKSGLEIFPTCRVTSSKNEESDEIVESLTECSSVGSDDQVVYYSRQVRYAY